MNIPLVRAPKDDASDFDTGAWRDTTFDLQSIVDMIRRRWRLLALVWLAVAALGLAVALIAPAKYQAVALVLLGSGQERVLSPEQMVTGAPNASVGAAVESEMEILRSPALLGPVVDALNLSADPASSGRAGDDAARRNAAISALSRSVSVRRRGLSYSIEVAVRSGSPERAAQIANMLADLYLQDQLAARSAGAARAHAWLSQRLDELRAELAAKEAEIETFRQRSGLLAAEGSSLAEQQTTESLGAVLAARADVAEKEAQYAQAQRVIASGASGGSMAGALNSEVIRELRAREADIARRQADMEGRYTSEHPALLNVRAEREDIARQIDAEIARLTESLGNDVEIARARLNTLERSLGSSRHELNENNEALLRLRELEREAAATRGVYENFLQRDNEIDDQGSMQSTNARILARAFPPTGRDWGQLGLGVLMACAVGFLLGFAAVSGVEALDDTMRTPEDVQRKARLPTLALLPHLRSSAWRSLLGERHPAQYVMEKPTSAFTESVRVLRAALLFTRPDVKTGVLAVSSPLPNEGKTTVSLSLARVAALSGHRVLLIDCDQRRRSINDVLKIRPQKGLAQVVAGEATWRETLLNDEESGLHVLPLREENDVSADLFGSDGMTQLIGELRANYELIILDCPPIHAVAEARIVAQAADSVLLVARWDKTPATALRAAAEQVRGANTVLLGVVLNGVNLNASGSYYRACASYYAD